MGRTLDAIEQWAEENDCVIVSSDMWAIARDTMHKYEKIKQILIDIPYGGEATVRRIQKVVEDGEV